MKKTELNCYDVTVVVKETRVFSVNAVSKDEAKQLVDDIIMKTDILPIGKNEDCDFEIDISAEERNELSRAFKELSNISVSGSGKTRTAVPLSPKDLFSIFVANKMQNEGESNDIR